MKHMKSALWERRDSTREFKAVVSDVWSSDAGDDVIQTGGQKQTD